MEVGHVCDMFAQRTNVFLLEVLKFDAGESQMR
jgi:hypothetical protein